MSHPLNFDNFHLVLAQDTSASTASQTDAPPSTVDAAGNPAGNGATPNVPLGTPGQPGAPGTTAPPAAQQPGLLDSIWLPLLLVVVVMWVFLLGSGRKEKKKRAALLESLKKGQKVQTVGGVLGTVVEVRETEVIVKVDESSNARLRFARSAIQTVLEDKDADEAKPE